MLTIDQTFISLNLGVARLPPLGRPVQGFKPFLYQELGSLDHV